MVGPYVTSALESFITNPDFLTANADDVNRIAAARPTLDTTYGEVAEIDNRIAADTSLFRQRQGRGLGNEKSLRS